VKFTPSREGLGKHIKIDEEYARLNYETLPARTPAEAARKKASSIKNLRKVYSNGKVAVHNLNMTCSTTRSSPCSATTAPERPPPSA
jgi:hypothetical protein